MYTILIFFAVLDEGIGMEPIGNLSDREEEVVQLLLEGKSNKLIAAALGISERTVEFHLTNIYAKYQVSSRTELILKLRESTVASQGQDSENRVRLNLRSWAESIKVAVSKIGKEFNVENSVNTQAPGAATSMTFFEAIRACFRQYAEFNGRASRSEFWWFFLFVVLVASALALLHEVASSMFLITVLLPLLAAGARRLRDTGRSAWWLLFLLAPVGGIVVLSIFWAMPPIQPLPDDTLTV